MIRAWHKGGAAGAVLASSWIAPAQATPGWTTDAGVYLAYHFGPGAPGHFSAGIEGRHLYGETDVGCGGSARFAGAVARIELVGFDHVRLVVGPQIGKLTAVSEVAADLSLGVRLGSAPSLLLEPGFEGAFIQIFKARLAYAIKQDFSVGGGLRVPRAATLGCAVEGRPLRRDGGRAMLPAAVLVGADLPAPERQRRAMQVWATRACAEWASAPAFCELRAQLVASGAPAILAERALSAAEDEVRHAVLAAAVTAQLGGHPVSLEPPALDRRPPAGGAVGLERLAIESWLDGCLGEAAAAAALAAEAEVARAPALRAAQRAIAEDESRHAALAWDVLAWTLSVGGPRVLAALAPALAAPPAEDPAGDDDLAAYGCLAPAARRQIATQVRASALQRLSEGA